MATYGVSFAPKNSKFLIISNIRRKSGDSFENVRDLDHAKTS